MQTEKRKVIENPKHILHDTRTREKAGPSSLLVLVCLAILRRFRPEWIATTISKAAYRERIGHERVSRLCTRALPCFEETITRLTQAGRPSSEKDACAKEELALVTGLLESVMDIYPTLAPIDEHTRSRLVTAWHRLRLEHGALTQQRFSRVFNISERTLRQWLKEYATDSRPRQVKRHAHTVMAEQRHAERTKRLLELLHHQPRAYGINRTSWTQRSLVAAYQDYYGESISNGTVGSLLRNAGYRWRKAKRVLTSPDPHYREKVELLLDTLQSLKPDEMFFFVDELGPIRVKRHGGSCYVLKGTTPTVPQRQSYRGSITMAGALSATTNQMSWTFEEGKQTSTMIDLIEILFNQYYEKTRLYVTWDAAAWHRSNDLLVWLDAFNTKTIRLGEGPVIELIPLPSSAQFLDVIEAVFSAMKRAVIHHSDYKTELDMKSAISAHFRDRNDYFTENPRRNDSAWWVTTSNMTRCFCGRTGSRLTTYTSTQCWPPTIVLETVIFLILGSWQNGCLARGLLPTRTSCESIKRFWICHSRT